MKRTRFLHIPKTAGSTFAHILMRQYRQGSHFAFQGEIIPDTQRYNKLTNQEKQEIQLFLGHAPIVTGIPDADKAVIITFLRDPIKRVMSFCQHASEGKAPYLLKDFPPESFRLDDFLDNGPLELSNLQTKMLINNSSCVSPALLQQMSPREAMDLALENLHTRVKCFGIQEYFDESLIHIYQSLNWSFPFYLSVNKKDAKHLLNFEQHHIDRIAELNSIDIEVYNAAKKQFLAFIRNKDFDRSKLQLLRRLNPLISIYLKTKYGINKMRKR